MTAFATAVAAIFRDPNMGVSGTLIPVTPGRNKAIRCIVGQPDVEVDWGEGRAITDSVRVEISAREVETLRRGDRIDVGAQTLEIVGDPRLDSLGLVWSAPARRVRP